MIPNLIGDGDLFLLTVVDKCSDSMMINTKYEPKESMNIQVV